jgi:hypothetical protein
MLTYADVWSCLSAQVQELHVLRFSDVARATQVAALTVQDHLLAKEAEIQKLHGQLYLMLGELEAARRDREVLSLLLYWYKSTNTDAEGAGRPLFYAIRATSITMLGRANAAEADVY